MASDVPATSNAAAIVALIIDVIILLRSAFSPRSVRRTTRTRLTSARSEHESKTIAAPSQSLLRRNRNAPSQHLGVNENHPAVDHVERASGARREVEHAMLSEWTAIVDGHGDGSAGLGIGDAHARAEWQRFMRRSQAATVRRIEGAQS